ncbi:MAG: hypothetical protein HQ517_15100 [SAR324 cluster bacterium]|nr:hypothetical protein [SAR324 cluster bacterium]
MAIPQPKPEEIKGKFDPVSLEFREIILQHINLLKSNASGEEDIDQYEKNEASNQENLNVIAYCISFLVFKFVDVDSLVHKTNLNWVTKTIINSASKTGKGRKLDKACYYSLKDKLREYLQSINADLTRIDGQANDVWQHGYEKLDSELSKHGIQRVLE